MFITAECIDFNYHMVFETGKKIEWTSLSENTIWKISAKTILNLILELDPLFVLKFRKLKTIKTLKNSRECLESTLFSFNYFSVK